MIIYLLTFIHCFYVIIVTITTTTIMVIITVTITIIFDKVYSKH